MKNEMEAKNLRMGNFVYYLAEDDDNKPIKYIDKIDGTDIHQMQDDAKYAKSHEPILITEKWLINLGFNKFPGSGQLFDTDDFWAGRLINDGFFEISHLQLTLKYIHDLQNVFFALTGRELELKDYKCKCQNEHYINDVKLVCKNCGGNVAKSL